MTESDRKRGLILDGAIKRFSHFGINKTTMAEIAEDLSVTKPALYYYFPDKQSIIVAVADKIIKEYLENFIEAFEKHQNTEDALLSLIDLRRHFSEKYFMLHIGEEYTDSYLRDPALMQVVQKTKVKEVEVIASSFQSAINKGEFSNMDTTKTAELFIDTLNGIAVCMKMGKISIPDADTFELLSNKQKDVARIFLNGLKNHSNGRTDIK